MAHYFRERAAGGVGLIIHSLPLLPVAAGRMSPFVESSLPSFAAVANLVHAEDTKLFGQLNYWWGSHGEWEYQSPARPTLSPTSVQRFDHYAVTHEMSTEEIDGVISAFRINARNLRDAGYDGIEVHCTHGVILEQFASPYWNQRTDEYGGSLDNRLRLLIEALAVVRETIGSQMALGLRFNCDEMLPGGWDQDGAREILGNVNATGLLDFIDLDVGVEPNQFPLGMPNYQIPKFSNEGFVANVRPAAGDLVVLSALGRVTSVADAERAIAAGSTDLVGAARGLIAEPEMVRKARDGEEHRSRRCIACNYCMDQIRTGWGCAINPASARERRWGVATLSAAPNSRKVVIVGGGPAGLEAARVSALRGHEIELLERNEKLGGQYVLWSSLPGREGYYDAIDWFRSELNELGVSVRTGVEATRDSILAASPDAVILATGSRYARGGESGFMPAPIPGAERPFVYSPEQILEDGARPSGNVLVLDDEGLNTGVGIAEILAKGGAEVELVTRWLHVAHNLFFTFEFALIIPLLKNLGVRLSPQTYVKRIDERSATVFDVFTNSESERTDLDAIVLVTMRKPVQPLAEALRGEIDQLFVAGDALAPRGHGEAFYEGSYFARMIGDPDAPKTFSEAFFRPVPLESYPAPAATLMSSAHA